jgi:hypothetical protein
MKATIEDVIVFYKVLDGGPVICGACITAWRPSLVRCPNCGAGLYGEQGTTRAYNLYKIQRKNEAPEVWSEAWVPYLKSQGIEVSDQS